MYKLSPILMPIFLLGFFVHTGCDIFGDSDPRGDRSGSDDDDDSGPSRDQVEQIVEDYCEGQAECDSDFSVEECIDEANEANEDAEAEDESCPQEAYDYTRCIIDNSSCVDFGDGQEVFAPDEGACDDEYEILLDCIDEAETSDSDNGNPDGPFSPINSDITPEDICTAVNSCGLDDVSCDENDLEEETGACLEEGLQMYRCLIEEEELCEFMESFETSNCENEVQVAFQCGSDNADPEDGSLPNSWTCPDDWYGTDDGCDEDCGAYDPDCD